MGVCFGFVPIRFGTLDLVEDSESDQTLITAISEGTRDFLNTESDGWKLGQHSTSIQRYRDPDVTAAMRTWKRTKTW